MKSTSYRIPHWLTLPVLALALAGIAVLAGGCSDDDECVTCIDPPPVTPTQVYSVSGDNQITLYWSDYAEIYGDIAYYRVYSRAYTPGDEDSPDRFTTDDVIAEVSVGTNYDPTYGQYHYVDDFADVEGDVNGLDFEYAVDAVAADGQASRYLSFELVIDTPLPMSEQPVELVDTASDPDALGAFDFSLLDQGRVAPGDPDEAPDVRVVFDEGVPYLETTREDVLVQDYGTFIDGNGDLLFSGLSWGPEQGYSSTGRVELIAGHIYALKILSEPGGTTDTHYAKLGVDRVLAGSVLVMWAYQVQPWLPELAPPAVARPGGQPEFEPIRL